MFTGIIKEIGFVDTIQKEGTNIHFWIRAEMSSELKIDESVAHNGVCLTVVEIEDGRFKVTAIEETLKKTSLGELQVDHAINLERAMLQSARFDGHMVQGHVDTVGRCLDVQEVDGSWYYTFEYDRDVEHVLVDKGSVAINGTSLTVVEPVGNQFKVAIIPYTYAHTTFKFLKKGDSVNLEFDIMGKYVAKYVQLYMNK